VSDLPCFKSYDLRGRIPDELNSEIAYLVGRAYAEFLKPSKVVVGHDIRLSSPMICDALIDGITDSGCDVYHIGECGTEEIYFATDHFDMDGGIVVTASHNPKDYNGMKLVREASKPISGDTGLEEIKQLVLANNFSAVQQKGSVVPLNHRAAYVDKLIKYIDPANIKPLKIVTNAGNGGAGAIIDRLESSLPFEFIKVHHQADGNFPNGVPNPLLEENREPTIAAIQEHGADLGIAWDGDFDRCFFFDADGRFIEGYYIVGLLAQSFLDVDSHNNIIHDPRLTWNTIDIVNGCGGTAIQSKTGHAFIKERMRLENAIYGGEMSAHHYFRDFSYCDSGMVPWLLVVGLMCSKGKSLAELVNERMMMFPASGEINRRIDGPASVIEAIEQRFKDSSIAVDHTDGLSMEFADWRFNVRMSNTEPVVRLNVESRANEPLMQNKTAELLSLMREP
jgi:phosphomannomutase